MHLWNGSHAELERAWIQLDDGDSLRLSGARDLRIQASASTGAGAGSRAPHLWLTESGRSEDVFLRPGDSHRVRGNGRVIATAFGPIRLRVRAPDGGAAPEVRERSWREAGR